jgi:hypothetical protein
MPIKLGDKIVRKASTDTYPLMDGSSIYENFYVVKTTGERDLIPSNTLGLKAACFVTGNQTLYYFARTDTTTSVSWQTVSLGVSLPAGSVSFEGSYNASTNTPDLTQQNKKTKGHLYIIGVSGTTDINSTGAGISFLAGDFVIYTGSTWDKISASTTTPTWGNVSGKPTSFPISLKNNGTDTNAGTVDILNIKNGSFASSTNNNIKTVELTLPTTKISADISVKTAIGDYKNGDTITKDTEFELILKKILSPTTALTYTLPTIALTVSPGTATYEVGSTPTLTFTTAYTKNDAGSTRVDTATLNDGNDFWIEGLITIPNGSATQDFKKYNASVNNNNTITDTWTKTSYALNTVGTYTFQTKVYYDQAPLKSAQPGEDATTNRFGAGFVIASRTITVARRAFYGTPTAAVNTSTLVRNLSTSILAPVKNTEFNIPISSGSTNVVFAFPSSLYTGSEAPVVTDTIFNQDITGNFDRTTVSVEGANSSTAVNYYVYTYTPQVSFSTASNYRVKI